MNTTNHLDHEPTTEERMHLSIDDQIQANQERQGRLRMRQNMIIDHLARFLQEPEETISDKIDRVTKAAEDLAKIDQEADKHQAAIDSLGRIDRGE